MFTTLSWKSRVWYINCYFWIHWLFTHLVPPLHRAIRLRCRGCKRHSSGRTCSYKQVKGPMGTKWDFIYYSWAALLASKWDKAYSRVTYSFIQHTNSQMCAHIHYNMKIIIYNITLYRIYKKRAERFLWNNCLRNSLYKCDSVQIKIGSKGGCYMNRFVHEH